MNKKFILIILAIVAIEISGHGIFAVYRMKIRPSTENPDSQFVAVPTTITPVGMELNPTTEPIEEPEKIN